MNARNLPVYASQGALVPIQPLVDDGSIDVDAYPESLRSIYTFDGTVYGIPRDFDTIALFYNKDLFDKAGVEYPTGDWTWDDLRAAAEKLTIKEGDTATQWGFGSTTSDGKQNYFNLIKQNGGEILNEDHDRVAARRAGGVRSAAFAGISSLTASRHPSPCSKRTIRTHALPCRRDRHDLRGIMECPDLQPG